MKFPARLRPSPAMVVALVALSVALGGAGYAATVLPAASVGTAHLKNNAVTAAKVRNGAVTAAKITNNAITAAKVRNGSLLAVDFRAGQLPAGPPGAPGPAGVPGAPGEAFGKLTYVAGATVVQTADRQDGGIATCPAGQRPVGGGVLTESPVAGQQQINSSFPGRSVSGGQIDSWIGFVDKAAAGTTLSFQVMVVCAPATNVTESFARALR